MDQHQWSLRMGASVIMCATLLRLASSGFFQPVVDFLSQPKTSSFLLYLETGRVVRFSASEPETLPVLAPVSTESPAETTVPTEPPLPAFSPEDAAAVEMKYSCSLRPSLETLITRPLQWDLTGEDPTVLILHTHTTESYTKSEGESYEEDAAFRTLAEDYNMVSIGERVAQLLSAGGITVLHDQELHDYPSYNGSYSHARKSTKAYLEQYPSIRLVLDLHRDASGDNNNQMSTHATVNGADSAQLMVVMGTNGSGTSHNNWEENMALGLKLHTQLERIAPGICRPMNLRGQRFNQDLAPGALLIEVGAAGNTHAEALVAAEVLAEGILALAKGAEIQ